MLTTPRPADEPTPRPPSLGRVEMTLAEFPISVVTKIQPREKDGRKLEEISYESSIYDPTTRRRIPQRVTLSP